MAERAGFEPARQLYTVYPLSRRAPSAKLGHLSKKIALKKNYWILFISITMRLKSD
jgi:hypothetical protein